MCRTGPSAWILVGQDVVHRHDRMEPERTSGQPHHRHARPEPQPDEAVSERDAPEVLGVLNELAHPQKCRMRRLEDLLAADELANGDVFAGLVRDLDVSRTEDHGARAERGHLRSLGPEAHRRRVLPLCSSRNVTTSAEAGVSTPRSVRRMRIRTSQPGSSRRSWNMSCSMA